MTRLAELHEWCAARAYELQDSEIAADVGAALAFRRVCERISQHGTDADLHRAHARAVLIGGILGLIFGIAFGCLMIASGAWRG